MKKILPVFIFCLALTSCDYLGIDSLGLDSLGSSSNDAAKKINDLGTINYMLNEVQNHVYENIDNSEELVAKLKQKNEKTLWSSKVEIPKFEENLFENAIAAQENLPEEINNELGNLIPDVKNAIDMAKEKCKELNNTIDSEGYKDDYDAAIGLCTEVQSIYEYLSEMTSTIGGITDAYFEVYEFEALPSGKVGDAKRNMLTDLRMAEDILEDAGYFWEEGVLDDMELKLNTLEKNAEEHGKFKDELGNLAVSYELYYETWVNNYINETKTFIRDAKEDNIKEKDAMDRYNDMLTEFNYIIDGYNSFNELESQVSI